MRFFQLTCRDIFKKQLTQNAFVYKRFYNTGLLRKTTSLPDKVGLSLSKDQQGNSILEETNKL
jgi:hypothetical protein